MKKIIKRVGLAGPALLMASLLVSCGGDGGGASSSFTPTNITTQSQASASSESVRVINELVSLGSGQISTVSVDKSKGFLKAVLKTIEDKKLQEISTKEIINCDVAGTAELVQTGDTSGYITFSNCQPSECETLNGTLEVSYEDQNGNNIPENLTFVFKKEFSYSNTCENNYLNIKNDFSMSMNGKLPGNDIYTEGGMKIKAEIVFNGGDIYADDAGRRSLAHFYNLKFFGNEADNDQIIEYSIDGGISFKNDCVEDAVNAVFETVEMFKEYVNTDCPYAGKFSINDGQVFVEAYDPDNDPTTVNKIRISLGDEVIFDNDCTNLESLGVCPE